MSTTTATGLKTTSAQWDKTSTQYAKLVGSAKGLMEVPTQRMFDLLDSYAPLTGASGIMDIGCGPGNATSQLIRTFANRISPTARFIAGDFSPGMVRLTTELRETKLAHMEPGQERNIWARLTPLVLDATDLKPLLDDSLSHIIANHVFFLTGDPRKCVAESHRVLSPGGVLAVSSWHKASWLKLLAVAADRTMSSLGKSAPQEPQFPPDWATVEAVREQLGNSGFRDIRAEYVETAITATDPEAWARTFTTSGNPAVTWVTDLLEDSEVRELGKHFAQLVKERCDVDEAGAFRIVGTAIVAVCRK